MQGCFPFHDHCLSRRRPQPPTTTMPPHPTTIRNNVAKSRKWCKSCTQPIITGWQCDGRRSSVAVPSSFVVDELQPNCRENKQRCATQHSTHSLTHSPTHSQSTANCHCHSLPHSLTHSPSLTHSLTVTHSLPLT